MEKKAINKVFVFGTLCFLIMHIPYHFKSLRYQLFFLIHLFNHLTFKKNEIINEHKKNLFGSIGIEELTSSATSLKRSGSSVLRSARSVGTARNEMNEKVKKSYCESH